MSKQYILALDQGTTSSRALLFDLEGKLVGIRQQEFPQLFPQPGWVEHDPNSILNSQIEVAKQLVDELSISSGDIVSIGITNQRETTVVWDRRTGKAMANAIVWQDRRTASICEKLKKDGWEQKVRSKTGLVIDAYFSGTKLHWLLEQYPEILKMAENGKLCFGTIDSWLTWHLTGGEVHATDPSNASRTMLYNIHEQVWDEELLALLRIPSSVLPEVRPSAGDFGKTTVFGSEIPINGIAGDQQAALFGQACFLPGEAKNTYGTGCFMLMNTGESAVESQKGLLTTIAWQIGDRIEYALEGSVFVAGAAIQWLRDNLQLIDRAEETEFYARQVPDTAGVYVVPAFTGLGTPYWDMYARGTISGLTRGATKTHIIRATLESIAYQTRDVLAVMQEESGLELQTLSVDGGATSNDFLMQFQADILNTVVSRSQMPESTAFGAACLAGIGAGVWSKEQLAQKLGNDTEFFPEMDESERTKLYSGWKDAVRMTMVKKHD